MMTCSCQLGMELEKDLLYQDTEPLCAREPEYDPGEDDEMKGEEP